VSYQIWLAATILVLGGALGFASYEQFAIREGSCPHSAPHCDVHVPHLIIKAKG
jgi:hypothetical protein